MLYANSVNDLVNREILNYILPFSSLHAGNTGEQSSLLMFVMLCVYTNNALFLKSATFQTPFFCNSKSAIEI
jgi:hypothetical protein